MPTSVFCSYQHRASDITVSMASKCESASVAPETLNKIGEALYHQGDLSGALDHFRRCLAIQEIKAPGSLAVAESLNNIGSVLWNQGDLSGALNHFRRCLAIRDIKAPGTSPSQKA